MIAVSVSDFSPSGKGNSRWKIYLGSTTRGKSKGSASYFGPLGRKEISSEAASGGRV